MNAAVPVLPGDKDASAARDSFYHLRDSQGPCRLCHGLSCFVARHLDPARWAAAVAEPRRIYCLGECFAAPAAGNVIARPHMEGRGMHTIVLKRLLCGGARTLECYRLQGGYRALEKALRQRPEAVLRTVEASELRGRGGAGFPTGLKWRSAVRQPAGEKVIIANADEGDAGAYIDRLLLEDDPHAVLEGMIIAAYACGAAQGWIYVRREYPGAVPVLEHALEEARAAGLLGSNALGYGRSFDIQLVQGRGSYICGEETALIKALEGRRPEPQPRQPFSTEHGLNGRPTVMNNVETLVNIPWIIGHGAGEYSFMGFSKSRGTKVFSLNSLFRRPGLYELEFGVTVGELVEMAGGLRNDEAVKGLIIGGPLAGIIPPSLFATRIAFEELHAIGASVGHGGVVAFDRHTGIVELMHHVFEFAAYESCGKCTPCRLGTRRVERALAAALAGRTPAARDELVRVVGALKSASFCAFGTCLADFAESVLRHYQEELQPCLR